MTSGLRGLIVASLLSLGACIHSSDDVHFEPCDGAVEIAPACAICVAAQCDEARATCATDEACCEDYTCLARCAAGDAVCRAACLDAPGRRSDRLNGIDACRRTTCAEACVVADDVVFGWPEACEACLGERCLGETRACAGDATCEANIVCDAACEDPACYPACWLATDPDGRWGNACDGAEPEEDDDYVDPFSDYWGCLIRRCRVECGLGVTWGCVGAFRWPAPDAEVVDGLKFSYHVYDYINISRDVEGASVSACQRGDVTCAQPVDTATTDADGYACLEVPVASNVGFTGFFRVVHEDYVTIDEQYGRPLYASGTSELIAISKAADSVFWATMDMAWDPSRGLVTVELWDCTWEMAPGVAIEISTADDETVRFYVTGSGDFSFTQTESSIAGIGAFVNVPVTDEPARVIARLAETGEIVGCHEVYVRPGVRTNLTLYPFDEPNYGCPGGLL